MSKKFEIKDGDISDGYHTFGELYDHRCLLFVVLAASRVLVPQLVSVTEILMEALEKIADPRKRDHKEPDAYTQLGCVMNIANEALESAARILEEK